MVKTPANFPNAVMFNKNGVPRIKRPLSKVNSVNQRYVPNIYQKQRKINQQIRNRANLSTAALKTKANKGKSQLSTPPKNISANNNKMSLLGNLKGPVTPRARNSAFPAISAKDPLPPLRPRNKFPKPVPRIAPPPTPPRTPPRTTRRNLLTAMAKKKENAEISAKKMNNIAARLQRTAAQKRNVYSVGTPTVNPLLSPAPSTPSNGSSPRSVLRSPIVNQREKINKKYNATKGRPVVNRNKQNKYLKGPGPARSTKTMISYNKNMIAKTGLNWKNNKALAKDPTGLSRNKATQISPELLWKFGIIIVNVIDERTKVTNGIAYGKSVTKESPKPTQYLMQFGHFKELYKAIEGTNYNSDELRKMINVDVKFKNGKYTYNITLRNALSDKLGLKIASNAFYAFGSTSKNMTTLEESTNSQYKNMNNERKKMITSTNQRGETGSIG